MLPENEKRLRTLAKASEALPFPYVIVEYQGRMLLISKGKLASAVSLTWERIHDPETAVLAKDLGVELRKVRGVVLQP